MVFLSSGHGGHRERLEVCGNGIGPTLSDHIYLLHNRGYGRSTLLRSAHHCHVKNENGITKPRQQNYFAVLLSWGKKMTLFLFLFFQHFKNEDLEEENHSSNNNWQMELVNKIFFSNLISSFRSLFSFILTPTKNAQYFFASSSVLFVFIENSLKGIKIWKKQKQIFFSELLSCYP